MAAPQMPAYTPQPNWSGADYYSAHYGQPDNSLFDYVWSRVRGAFVGQGYSRDEAKYWHRRVYGGLIDIPGMEPKHVGAAAGYEALRIWQYHKAIYRQPLSDDHEREREALAGLAIGEASKLWQYTGRFSDKYGRREACEIAAATAERVFNEKYDYDSYEAYGSRSRRGSFSRAVTPSGYYEGSAYGGSGYGDDYDHERRLRRRASAYDMDYARPASAMGYSAAPAVGYMPTTPAMGVVQTPYVGAGYATASPAVAYGAYPQAGYAAGAYPTTSAYGGAAAYPVGSPYAAAGYPATSAYGGGAYAAGAGYNPAYGGSAYGGSAYGGGYQRSSYPYGY